MKKSARALQFRPWRSRELDREALDDPLLLEARDTFLDGGSAYAKFFGKIAVGEAGILLEKPQKFPV